MVDIPTHSLAERISITPTRLGGVTYRLAGKKDYRAAHAFMAEQGAPRNTLGFPTIIAEKDGEVLGLLGTHVKNDMILAGPLVVKGDKPRYFTLIRLIEAYESVMRGLGVVSYIFNTDNPKLKEYAKDLGLEPYAEKDGISFYVRHLDG